MSIFLFLKNKIIFLLNKTGDSYSGIMDIHNTDVLNYLEFVDY